MDVFDILKYAAPAVVSIISLLWSWMISRAREAFVTKEQFEKLENKFLELSEENHDLKVEITGIQADLKYVPHRDSVHDLAIVITELNGNMKTMGAENRGMSKQLSNMSKTLARQEEYLLNKKDK
jgi:predicted nuclease with TOPRIM domain